MSLWKSIQDNSNNTTESSRGADNLIPTTQATSNKGFIVDVIGEYTWTISPKTSRIDTPYVYLIEKRVTNKVLIQQAIYHTQALYEAGNVTSESILQKLQDFSNSDSDEELKNAVNQNTEINDKKTINFEGDIESPYKGLYALEDTGWQYVFPYFDTSNKAINSNWGENTTGVVQGIANKAFEASENVADVVNTIQAVMGAGGGSQRPVGTYIEKPKQFLYGSGGSSYTVTFKLYNTFNYEDIIKNWELCFLLIYQNLPNRRTKTIIDPPSLYEFVIPGVKHSPLAFIKSLKIDFEGATRIMNITVGNNQNQIESIIPDAYKITLVLEDIFPESKNFLQGVLDENKKITVSNSNTSFSYKAAQFSFSVENKSNIFSKIGNAASSVSKKVKDAISGVFGGGG